MASVRELGRVDHWWYSKVAPALAVSYCAALLYRVPVWATARSILAIAFIGLCAGSYGHLINDAFDIEVDRKAGKRNRLADLAPWQRYLFCTLALLMGFVPALVLSFSRASILLLAIEYLLPTVYSVPPLRLKGRGMLGLLCDSLGAHLIPCLFVISVLAHETSAPAPTHSRTAVAFSWLVAAWSLCLGLIGIIIHEFEDRENDIQSGIRTFASELSLAAVRGPVTALYAAELLSFLGLATLLIRIAPLIAILAAVYIAATAIRLAGHWHHYGQFNDEQVTIQWWQLSHPFYEGYFPVAAAIHCAWLHPALTAFPLLQMAAFAPTFRRQLLELREVRTQLLLGGRLDVDQGASANVSAVLFPWATRIQIRDGGSERWNIRLVRRRTAIRAGCTYVIQFKIRADNLREIVFGVWQDHAPWEVAGICETLAAVSEWKTVRRTFVPVADDASAYFGIWLGQDTTSVELRGLLMERVR